MTSLSTQTSRFWHLSVGRLFALLLIGLFAFFLISGAFMYRQLVALERVLADISKDGVPAMIDASQTFSQANLLLNSIQELTMASTSAAQRIALSEVENKLNQMLQTNPTMQASVYEEQIRLIREELDSLNVLIAQKLAILNQIQTQKTALFVLLSDMQRISQQDSAKLQSWATQVAAIVAQTTESMSEGRLYLLRDKRQLLANQINQLSEVTASLPASSKDQVEALNESLNKLVTGENGLFKLKAEQLRVNGRAIGRGHFVTNMVEDFSRDAEAAAVRINQRAIGEVAELTATVNRQSRTFIVIAFLTGLLLLLSMNVVRKRIIHRLVLLNRAIKQYVPGEADLIDDDRQDEIGELVRSFRQFANTLEIQQEKLKNLSLTDELTNIANRRHFEKRLEHELRLAQRHQWPLSLLLIDVDYFKAYNDFYGHSEGDTCLKTVAAIISKAIRREVDLAARFGGEEFVCILPSTDKSGAMAISHQLHALLYQANLPHHKSLVSDRVTWSIGVATSSAQEPFDRDTLILHADTALYHSKQSGRNTTTHHDQIDPARKSHS